jgi:hypothetical protein
MDLEADMARPGEVTVLEVASVVAHHLLDGMVGDVAVMVQVDLALAERPHPDMVRTLTTVLKVAWPQSSDSVRKISLLEEDLHPAVARPSAGLSRWTSVPAAHLVAYPIKYPLMV